MEQVHKLTKFNKRLRRLKHELLSTTSDKETRNRLLSWFENNFAEVSVDHLISEQIIKTFPNKRLNDMLKHCEKDLKYKIVESLKNVKMEIIDSDKKVEKILKKNDSWFPDVGYSRRYRIQMLVMK